MTGSLQGVVTDELKDPQVVTKLAAALTSHDLAQALLSIAASLEGSAAVVYLLDRQGELRVQSSRGAARWRERFPVLTLQAPVPLAAAIASGTGMFLETRAELEERDPATANIERRFQAEAALPLLADGRLLGAFGITFDRARQFQNDERHWLTGIALQAGLAANRVRLFEDLTQAVRLNELFIGVLAHDLRQPVAAVAMSATLLPSREGTAGTDQRGARARNRILQSAARMSRMIDQLLDFTRLRIGAGLSLEPATSELAPLVAQIAEEVCEGGSRDTVAVESVGDTRGTWDADRLGQVLSNLIGNAVQHGAGGKPPGVRVVVDGTEPESVRVRVHNVGTIAADLLPKLFEPLNGGERRRGGARGLGLGLGLYIAKEIVAAHGGRLTVTSNEAEGTIFTVSLPRSCATTGWPVPRLLREEGGGEIAGLHAFEQVVGSTTPPQREARLPAFGIPTVHARLHAVKLQLDLRRLEAAGLHLETRRLRDKFLTWPTRHRATRSRTRQNTASRSDEVRRSASDVTRR